MQPCARFHSYVRACVRSSTYTRADMCAAPANETIHFINPGRGGAGQAVETAAELMNRNCAGYTHDAVMTNLKLNTRYYYVFGDPSTGWSDEFSFLSSPGVGPDVHVHSVVYGDLGVRIPFDIQTTQQSPAAKTVHWCVGHVRLRVCH